MESNTRWKFIEVFRIKCFVGEGGGKWVIGYTIISRNNIQFKLYYLNIDRFFRIFENVQNLYSYLEINFFLYK